MRKIFLLSILTLSIMTSCENVDVENFNDPDLAATLANANDYPATLNGAYYAWWNAIHKYSPYMTLSVSADHGSSSWGNFNMRNVGTVTAPYGLGDHAALNNTQTAPSTAYLTTPWYQLYSGTSTANDVLSGIRITGNKVMDGTTDITPQTTAQALVARGLCYGYLGLLFDQGFVVTEANKETVDLTGSGLLPHTDLINQGIADLEEAKTIINGLSSFQITQFNGLNFDKAGSLALINTFIAKILANSARTPAETAALDWGKIKTAAENGITANFAPLGDGGNNWWHAYFLQGNHVWMRLDQKVVNMANPTNNPFPFPESGSYTTPTTFEDSRFGAAGSGKYFTLSGNPIFRPDRGIYFFSYFKFEKYNSYRFNLSSPMVSITAADNDLLLAEALVRTSGDLNMAATLINKTRVNNGGLTPAAAGDADLLDKIFYERYLEAYETPGNPFFDRRRSGTLGNKQFTQFPIPARELNTINVPLYTFGG